MFQIIFTNISDTFCMSYFSLCKLSEVSRNVQTHSDNHKIMPDNHHKYYLLSYFNLIKKMIYCNANNLLYKYMYFVRKLINSNLILINLLSI